MNLKKLYKNGCFPNVRFNLYGKWNTMLYKLNKEINKKDQNEPYYIYQEWLDWSQLIGGRVMVWYYDFDNDKIETVII